MVADKPFEDGDEEKDEEKGAEDIFLRTRTHGQDASVSDNP